MAMVQVSLSLADDHLDRFSQVVRECEVAGLQVEHQLEATGIVTGTIDEAKLADLEHVEGVAAVEPQREFRIAPPDCDVQ